MACENAKKITELNALECDIIIKHMWLATVALPKYKESYIVTFVDKFCAVKEVAVPLSGKVNHRVKNMWARLKTAQA
jgi:uncharacterized protein